MIVQETTVSEDNRAIGSGGKDTFFGIVDGMRQQGDVIAPLLDVGNVLYVASRMPVPSGSVSCEKVFRRI